MLEMGALKRRDTGTECKGTGARKACPSTSGIGMVSGPD